MDEFHSTTMALQTPSSGIHFVANEFVTGGIQRPLAKFSSDEIQRQNVEFLRRPKSTQQRSSLNCSAIKINATMVKDSAQSNEIPSDSECIDRKSWLLAGLEKAQFRKKAQSISEADLVAVDTRTTLTVSNDDITSSPTNYLPPPPGFFRRSSSLPTKLAADHHLEMEYHIGSDQLQIDRRSSSIEEEDSDCPLSPFVGERDDMVMELQRQLHERDAKMLEIRQEALSSVSQLHQLSAIVMEMKDELDFLKAENDRLQQLVKQNDDDPETKSSIDVWENPVTVFSSSGGSSSNSKGITNR